MPRIKKIESASRPTPTIKDHKTKKIIKKSEPAQRVVSNKKMIPSKKAKAIIVDVIEDEYEDKDEDEIQDSDNFFSDESLAKNNFSTIKGLDIHEVNRDDNTDTNIKNSDIENSDIKNENLVDTDIQKKFFSGLASEMKEKNSIDNNINRDGQYLNHKPEASHSKKSLNLYRRLVWKFLIMVGFLAAIVFYLFFSKLTIFITPQVEAMSDALFLRVGGDVASIVENDPRQAIDGSVNELDIEADNIYQSSGEKIQSEELIAKVIIINNYNKPQPLIATTRLLAADGKLFRLKDAVNIPAGGKVEVDVYPDKASSDMAIQPTHFTIPGLWAGLQDKIYAESKEAFTYGQKIDKYIKASDIQAATKDIGELILKKAQATKALRSQDKVLYQVLDSIDVKTSAEVGDSVSEFTVTAKAKVVMVSFSGEEVSKLASSKLNILVPDDKELAEFKPENLVYSLDNYDEDTKSATVKATFSGLMILKGDSNIIDKSKLVNLNAQQIDAYLKNYPEIGNYELLFSPYFVKRAPRLVDMIEIKIKQ